MISANQLAKAMANAPSLKEQNQAMEQVNADFADILGLLVGDMPGVKTVDDVRYYTSKAVAELRLMIALEKSRGWK